MTWLPETDGDRRIPGETDDGGVNLDGPDSDGNTGGESRFVTGFLSGCLVMLLCVLVFLAGWLLARRGVRLQSGSGENAGAAVLTDGDTLSKLDEVQALIQQNFLEEVDGETLSAYLFKGVAAGLQDSYAEYYSSQELQTLEEATKGEYFGIGATLTVKEEDGAFQVAEVYEGSPAQEGGLLAGDILLALNGASLEGSSLSEVVSLIKSQEESFILQVYRPDTEETLELSITCGSVELTYVQGEMIREQTGYIRITEFTESAVSQFRDVLTELLEQGMENLVVDLRGNPGGLLNSVCDILDAILPEKLLVYTENKDGRREEYYSGDDRLADCPVAVLVDGDSASASEIFAGAVQDWELGPIVGAQTYGKGVVQKTYTLTDGSAFKFTVSKYYTPGGQDIDGNGITPDIPVEDAGDTAPYAAGTGEETDPVLEAALEALSEGGDDRNGP